MTIALQNNIIYGPVNSRRLGKSLGVNLLPPDIKLCPFNCIYCQYGYTSPAGFALNFDREKLPSIDEVKTALIKGIETNPHISYITFSGNGEPTIHPDFPDIVDAVIEIRDKMIPTARTAILSNSAMVSDAIVVAALNKLNSRFMKLDCGDEKTFRRYNRCHKNVTFDDIISGLTNMRDIVIQSLFAGGSHGNATDENVDSWIDKIGIIKPLECHIYSLDRGPADGSLVRLDRHALNRIKDAAESRVRIPVHVF